MGAKQSSDTNKALKLIKGGMTRYAAAKKVGVALSTIYRAVKRQKVVTPMQKVEK
jgi:transposase